MSADKIIAAHINLQHACEHSAFLYWHGAAPDGARGSRHYGYMLEHLRKAADALGFDLVERKPAEDAAKLARVRAM